MPPQNSTAALDPQVIALAKAVRDEESGGNPTASGKSGEYGAYQYEPGTWKTQSAAAGVNVPLDQASLSDQNKVWYTWAKQKKDEGYTPGQIISMQNAGESEPDAYTGTFRNGSPSKGVNKEGVPFDVRSYTEKVAQKYQQYKGSTGNSYNPTPFSNPSDGSEFNLDLSGNAPTPQPTDGTLGDKLHGRLENGSEALSKAASGQINPLSGILQTVGAGAGAIGDTVNAVLDLIPGVKQAEGLLGKGVAAAANTGVGQSLIKGGTDFATAHPELAGDVGAVGDIASVLPVGKGIGLLKDAAGSAIAKSLGKDTLDSTIEAISPELKGKAAVSAAKQGLIKTPISGKIIPTTGSGMADIAQSIRANVPNFDKIGTFSEKLNAVRQANSTLAENLKNEVVSSGKDRIYPFKELESAMNNVDMPIAIKADPVLERQFTLARDAALKIAKDEGGTVSSLFDARKGFDQLVSKQFPNLYDRANAPMRDAITSVRNAMNDFIESKLPEGSGFKDKLREQSNLFRAVDNLAPKAAKEIGSTNMSRFAQRHPIVSGMLKKGAGAALLGAGFKEGAGLLP